mmetsp:Transcript_28141/g.47839  ORF Transcript_28141/g.47839 Transcript_28141/m.47839 type:complete len:217 (+) Transcript_28141:98-748(+)
MEKHPCPTCSEPHPMDPISVVASCSQAAHLQQEFIGSWPEPLRSLVAQWWHTKPTAKHKHICARTLLPLPLCDFLLHRMNLPRKMFCTQLQIALRGRRANTARAATTAKQWLIDHPRGEPLPTPVSGGLWNMTGSPMGPSPAVGLKREPQCHAPDPLPPKVCRTTATPTSKGGTSAGNKPSSNTRMHSSVSRIPQPFFSTTRMNFCRGRPQPEPPP